MIDFKEHILSGYANRTRENIKQSDVTLALAVNFNSLGEILTKKACGQFSKPYISHLITLPILTTIEIEDIAGKITDITYNPITLNIAGNGIYTLIKHGFSQKTLDFGMYFLLYNLVKDVNIASVVTGGQTGIDEAGAKAANKLQIPTTVRAPKGWMFRNEQGIDIKNEKLFKERFN